MKKQIKDEIIQGIVKAQQKGYTLVAEDWGDSYNQCACALGCVLVANDVELGNPAIENVEAAAEILDVSEEWVESFISGFDNTPPDPDFHEEAYLLGKDLRDSLKPIDADIYKNLKLIPNSIA